MLVIPIQESLIYVRPLYLRSAGGRIPELKRVIVAHQNQIVMEETLDQALNRLFPPGGRPAEPPPDSIEVRKIDSGATPPVVDSSLAVQARDLYHRATVAQREGNWTLYGEELRKLGDVLNQMAKP